MVVKLWERVFYGLSMVSVFYWLRRIPRLRKSSYTPEWWALANFFTALIAALCSPSLHRYLQLLVVIVASYGGLRVFEIVIYQINVILFDEYRAKTKGQPYVVQGYRRLILLLLHNYVEIMCWFAVLYTAFRPDFLVLAYPESPLGPLYGSFVTMTSFGSTNVSAANQMGLLILWVQQAIGFMMTLISFGRFISFLPIHRSMDKFEND